eukprot:scaffold605_cov36-Tisochrysis_lutea.AAC.3
MTLASRLSPDGIQLSLILGCGVARRRDSPLLRSSRRGRPPSTPGAVAGEAGLLTSGLGPSRARGTLP